MGKKTEGGSGFLAAIRPNPDIEKVKSRNIPCLSFCYQEDFLNILFWVKQILCLLVGCLFGFYKFEGIFGLISFAIIYLIFHYVYAFKFIQISEEKFEGQELFTDAIGPALSCFALSWIMTFTFSPQ